MNNDDWNQESGSGIDEDEDDGNVGNDKKKKESKSEIATGLKEHEERHGSMRLRLV
jgi:hypothetical protein